VFDAAGSFDVVDRGGEYVMLDWNHISTLESERLAVPFRTFLGAATAAERGGFIEQGGRDACASRRQGRRTPKGT
jgi:hypothetical protein